MFLKDNDLILFQGDSITDMCRTEDSQFGLGCGYVYSVASALTAQYPEKRFRFINRGISGNRVKDLQARWQEDMLDIKPDVLSILIGINDTWRRFDSNDPTGVEAFEAGYRDILTLARAANPDLRIILCEPFLLERDGEDMAVWRSDLDPKIHAVRKLSREFSTLYVPLDGLFAQACTLQPSKVWAADGVHPDPAGRALIARAWMDATGC